MMIRSLMLAGGEGPLGVSPGRSFVARRTMVFKPKASQPIYKCTWKGCGVIYASCSEITAHVRNAHLGPRKPEEDSDEEDFFFTEIEDESDSGSGHHHQQQQQQHHHSHQQSNGSSASSARTPPSPPTLSHRDMARPPHEDPEYQRQIVGNYRQGLLSMSSQQQQQQQQHQQQQHHQHLQLGAAIKPPLPASSSSSSSSQQAFHQSLSSNNNNNNTIGQGSNSNGSTGSSGSSSNGAAIHTSPLIHHNYTWSQVSPTSPQKHVRLSPRPSASYPYPSPNYSNQIAQQHHYQQQQHLGQIQLSPGAPGSTASYHHQAASLGGLSSSASQSLNGAGTFVTPGTSPGAASNRSPLSPNRRTRGENKKCRKVYGMDHKEQWCTQCKWKKACSRFGD